MDNDLTPWLVQARPGPDARADAAPDPLAPETTAVEPGECLSCYLERMLDRYGCRGHLFTHHWIDAQPQQQPRLMRWLQDSGGLCCDCEVLMNVLDRGRTNRRYPGLRCERARGRREVRSW